MLMLPWRRVGSCCIIVVLLLILVLETSNNLSLQRRRAIKSVSPAAEAAEDGELGVSEDTDTQLHDQTNEQQCHVAGSGAVALSSCLNKFIAGRATFEDTIALLRGLGDNCTSVVTENVRRFLSNIGLAEKQLALERHLLSVRLYATSPDGHAGMFPGQQALYVLLSHQPWVRQVCEIGFNAGHSALFWLAAGRGRTRVLSFDAGWHAYAKPMSVYLSSLYPGRLQLVWGDSAGSVPAFWSRIGAGLSVSCDVIVFDGSHQYEAVVADIVNMRVAADRKRHLLIFDDYSWASQTGVGKALVHGRQELGLLGGKLGDCVSYPDTERGMAFAFYKTSVSGSQ